MDRQGGSRLANTPAEATRNHEAMIAKYAKEFAK
jgi:hypothetical protein